MSPIKMRLRHRNADLKLPASGIGLAVVTRLLELGWNVAILDRQSATDRFTEHQLGNSILFAQTDVSVYKEQVEAFARTHEKWGRIDLGA